MKQKTFLITLTVIIISLQILACASSRIEVPGTKISLVPPEGFVKAERFPGFMQERTNASIMVTEIPAPYSELAPGFTKEELAKKDMILIDRSDVTLDGRKGILLSVSQKAWGETFLKWILVTGDQASTISIVAAFPERLSKELKEPLKDALQSARFRETQDQDPREGMTFEVREAGDLKMATRLGNNILITREGKLPADSPGDPYLFAGASVSQNMPVENRREFAIARLGKIDGVKETSIETIDEITIDNLKGFAITAAGKDSKSNAPLSVYLVILYEERDYYIICGAASAEKKGEYMPVFREIAESFKRKKQDLSEGGGEMKKLPLAESRFLAALEYPNSQDITDAVANVSNYQGKNGDTIKSSGYKLPIAWNRLWTLKTSDPVSKVLLFYKEKLPGASLDYTEKLGDISIDSYIKEHEGSYIIRHTPPGARAFSKDAQVNGRCVYPDENFTILIDKGESGETVIYLDEWILIE